MKPTTRQTAALLVKFLRYFVPYKTGIAAGCAAMLAGLALSLVQPIISKEIIDSALLQHNTRVLNELGIAFLVVAILTYAVSCLRQYYFAIVQQRVMATVRKRMTSHILQLPMAFHDRQNPGYLMARADADVGNLAGVMTDKYVQTLVDAITLIGAVAMLLAMNWRLALLSMASLPPFTWSVLYFGRRMRALSYENQETHAQVAARLQDVFNSTFIIKVFGRETGEVLRLMHDLHAFVRSTMKMTVLGLVCNLSIGCIATLAPLSIIWYGGYEVIQGKLTIGSLFAFNMYVAYLFTPLRNIYATVQSVQASAASLERVFELLDQPGESTGNELAGAGADLATQPVIEFRHVSFDYQAGRPTLTDISFRAHRGEKIALVGPSGAGKTTLFHLLLRLYDVGDGDILLNGKDLRIIARRSLRRVIRLVPQDACLFNRSVCENVRFGAPGARREEIERSLAQAYMTSCVQDLPDGLETVVGQRGAMLSAGQRQRISIARALVSNPEVLLLDEATAFLDANTEAEVQHAINNSIRGRTCLVIAHRLSTVVNADRIVVIAEGRVVDQGKHAELYSRCPLYASLCNKQFRRASSGLEFEEQDQGQVLAGVEG